MEFNATFLVSAISFIVFVFLMNIIFYGPLENIINQREKLVDDTLNEAKISKDTAQKILSEREEKLNNASNQSKELISGSIAKANNDAKDSLSNAKRKSVSDIEVRKQELNNQNIETQKLLEQQVDVLSDLIVTKVMDK